MKMIMAGLMCLSFFGVAQAESAVGSSEFFVEQNKVSEKSDTVLGMVDLSSVVSNLRASVLINSNAKLFYGGHIPVITFIGKKSKVEYININAGLVYSSDQKKTDFMMSLGIRLDSYLSKFGRSYPNVQTANLPAIEVGPFVSYGFNSWMYGGMLSIRLGK